VARPHVPVRAEVQNPFTHPLCCSDPSERTTRLSTCTHNFRRLTPAEPEDYVNLERSVVKIMLSVSA
jgi:hypothetical protein